MSSQSLDDIRLALAKLDPRESGRYGEDFARQWFKTNQWAFVDINQSPETKPAKLRALGGKRPDFVVESHNSSIITTVDAKFVTTNGGKIFAMPDWEIEQYRKFTVFAESEFPGCTCEVLFMVFPKENNGKRLVWVSLYDFVGGSKTVVRGEAATEVSLEDRAELWCNN